MTIPTKLVKTIVADIRKLCKKHGVKLVFDHQNHYLDGDKTSESSAYFSVDPDKVLVVSTKDRTTYEWLTALIHESCHLDQWSENSMKWAMCYWDGVDIVNIADLWIAKMIELEFYKKQALFSTLFELELDAEVRTVRKLVAYGLFRYISISRYTQEAWAYLDGYIDAYYNRQWLPADKQKYNDPDYVDKMPTNFSSLNYQPASALL